MRPLDGVRVLDLSQMWAAPGAAMYMADQGADVVKVEPFTGDDARVTFTSPALPNGESRSWLVVGRNKRGLALDLRERAGQEVIHRLIPGFDIVLVNFRPDAAERLRVDYETLRKVNPRLIYVHLTAYGQNGPYADRPGYDLIFQSLSGILSRRTAADGTPISAPVWVADCSAPGILAYGIVLALLMRERTGVGQVVGSSLLQAALAMQSVDAVRVEAVDTSDRRDYGRQAMYAPYRCADGTWLIVVVVQNQQWARLCVALDLEHMAADPRFDGPMKRAQESETLHEVLAAVFETRQREEWLAILQQHDIPSAPVLVRDEIYDHPQFRANGMFVDVEDPEAGPITMMAAPVRLSACEPPTYRPAPAIGQHSREVLVEAGFSPEEVDALVRDRVVGVRGENV